MKQHFKYAILLSLTILVTITLVNAPAPVTPIGNTRQASPYESNPTGHAYYSVGTPTLPERAYDKDLDSRAEFYLGSLYTVTPLKPTADVLTQWTPTPSGTHYTTLQSNDGATTRISAASVGLNDFFEVQDMPAGFIGGSLSVVVKAYAARTSTTANYIKLAVRVGGTIYPTADISLGSTSYVLKTSPAWTTNPVTGRAWTYDELNALQIGVVSSTGVASTNEARVTYIFAEVIPNTAYYMIQGFKNSPNVTFTVGFVDLKMKYNVPSALTDDKYTIEYAVTATVDPSTTWITLQDYTSSPYDRSAPVPSPAIKPWSQIAEPSGDGDWSWDDIANLKVRILANQTGTWDAKLFYLQEIWLSVYPLPLPPTGSIHLAVIPSAVYNVATMQYMFVDVYATEVYGMTGFSFMLMFDTNVLTPVDCFVYDPFHYANPGGPPVLSDADGWAYFPSSFMPTAEAEGFTGSEPLARIYFQVDQWGTSRLNILNSTEAEALGGFPPYKASSLYYVLGGELTHTVDDGWFSSPIYMSAKPPALIDLAHPLGSVWHEDYPTYSNPWILTSWDGNGDGVLSASDQIDMQNSTGWIHWFHVEEVTITIHWTFKPDGSTPEPGNIGIAEPDFPLSEMPPDTDPQLPDSPIHRWHQIYPDYCRMFNITSWEDTGEIEGTFDPSDQFDFEYDDEIGTTYYAHLDAVSTDIIVSPKDIPPIPGGPIPEFPFGVGVVMLLAPLIPIAILWKRKKVTKP